LRRPAAHCPNHADVANALGAVVGPVRLSATITITAPSIDVFRLNGDSGPTDHRALDAALADARAKATALARGRAELAGAAAPDITLQEDIVEIPVENVSMFVEARVTATATGRPRTAR
jgi:hypothetical protein